MEQLREIVDRLGTATRTLAALGAVIAARLEPEAAAPARHAALREVVVATGAQAALAGATQDDLRIALGALRSEIFLAARLVRGAGTEAGWDADDPMVLQAAGDASIGIAALIARVAPTLEGLAPLLAAPGAAFLDVGVGVASLSIAMAERFPTLRVVGIDPLAPALALAARNVREAGLAGRIALRCVGAECLDQGENFDLAWVPGLFIPASALPAVLSRVAGSLRAGGWLLLAHARDGNDPLTNALSAVRAGLWGGASLDPDRVADMLAAAGLQDVTTLPRPAHLAVGMVAGRRATS